MKNKFKLFLTFNYILIFSLNILLPIDIDPSRVTQMQIKSIQDQLKNKTISKTKNETSNLETPINVAKIDYIGGESELEILDGKG